MKVAPMHEFMVRHRDELLRIVVNQLQSTAPDADAEVIVSGVHELVDEIIRALQHEAGLPVRSPLPGASKTATWLGGRRQARGYAISRIAEDLGTISNTLGELARREHVSFPGSHYQVFNQCIDSASAQALEQYWNQAREEREHAEAERLGAVVHELRNTLAGARMSFSILKSGELGVTSRTGDVLERSLRRLESLIGEMVIAVQLGAGVKPELRRLALEAVLRHVLDASVPERGITLEAAIDESLMVDADEHLLISAVSNLVQNAFKFTHDNGRIRLRASRRQGYELIEIEDECGGLPPGKHEELFAPFVSKAADRRGIGLGLTIARDAIEAHGGQVSVTNLPGKGCVFRLTLPMRGGADGAP